MGQRVHVPGLGTGTVVAKRPGGMVDVRVGGMVVRKSAALLKGPRHNPPCAGPCARCNPRKGFYDAGNTTVRCYSCGRAWDGYARDPMMGPLCRHCVGFVDASARQHPRVPALRKPAHPHTWKAPMARRSRRNPAASDFTVVMTYAAKDQLFTLQGPIWLQKKIKGWKRQYGDRFGGLWVTQSETRARETAAALGVPIKGLSVYGSRKNPNAARRNGSVLPWKKEGVAFVADTATRTYVVAKATYAPDRSKPWNAEWAPRGVADFRDVGWAASSSGAKALAVAHAARSNPSPIWGTGGSTRTVPTGHVRKNRSLDFRGRGPARDRRGRFVKRRRR